MKKLKSILLSLAGVALGLYLLVTGWREHQESKAIADRGIETQGTVTDGSSRRRKGRRTYQLTVEFKTAQDRTVGVEREVGSKVYDGVRVGDPVPVFYLAETPEVCAVGVRDDIRYANLGFGALLFVVGAGWLVLGKKQPDIKELSAQIAKRIGNLCEEKPDYVPVNPADFGHLDLAFYDQTQAQLEQAGFVMLGDFRDRGLALEGSMKPPLIRLLAGDDGAINVALFHLKLMAIVSFRIAEFESEFSDGTLVATNNMAGGNPFTPPPGFDIRQMPTATKVDELLATHRQRVQAHLAGRPGVTPVSNRTAEAVIASQARQKEITTVRRQRIGVTDEEFKALMKDVPEELVPEIHAEVMRLHREKYPA